MMVGIDASNIRVGGGLTHLKELLSSVDIGKFGIDKIVIWSCKSTLKEIEDKPWLKKCTEEVMEKNYLQRALWQHKKLHVKLNKEKCDILFVPGGSFTTHFRPVVTMSQNLLPFALRTVISYGISLSILKFFLLRFVQSFSFKNANGTIFLTEYAKGTVLKVTGTLKGFTKVIPHGIEKKFFSNLRPQLKINEFSNVDPFQLLYVSNIEPYKHQSQVIDAVALLHSEGFPVNLKLIGSANSDMMLRRLKKKIQCIDPGGEFVQYTGMTPHEQLRSEYSKANIFVFASSCETFGMSLLEAMASGLPIACSSRPPMSDILGDAGVYFDPEDPTSITNAIRELLLSTELRNVMAKKAKERANKFTWEQCAHDTFQFLSDCI